MPPTGLSKALDDVVGTQMKDALRVLTKGERRQALMLVDGLVLSSLASKARAEMLRSPLCRKLTHTRARPVSGVGHQNCAERGTEEGDAAAAAGRAPSQ